MSYKFTLKSATRRIVDGAATGFRIAVRCDDTGTAGDSELRWFAPKSEFVEWPPTGSEMKSYVQSYLKETRPGAAMPRSDDMKQKAVVVHDDPDGTYDDIDLDVEERQL